MTLIAFDYGEKRIGIAVTNENGEFPTSLPYLSNNSELRKIAKKDFPKGTDPKKIQLARKEAKLESKIELRKVFNKIIHLLNSYYPDKIIFGLPLSFDAKENTYKEGQQAKKIRTFVKKLESFLKKNNIVCEFIFIEESITSKQAEENLKQLGLTSEKIREKIDSEAARILLENYLSNH